MTDVAVPVSIPSNGSVDVTAQLADFLNNLNPGDVAVFPTGGQYRIEETVKVVGKPNIGLRGKSKLYATDQALDNRNRAQLSFTDCDGLDIRDLRIEGAHPNPGTDGQYLPDVEAQHNLLLASCAGVTVQGCEFYKPYGDFITLSSKDVWPRIPVTNAVIRANYMRSCGRQGIAAAWADGVLIQGNIIDDVKRTAIDLEPNTAHAYSRNFTIRGNWIGRNSNGAINAVGDLGVLTVEGNSMERIGRRFNADPPSTALIFRGNHSRKAATTTAYSLLVYKWPEAFIEGNDQHYLTTNSTHRFMDANNVGTLYIRDNILPGLERPDGTDKLIPSTAIIGQLVVENNATWPIGYGLS